jgi:hypothetical protein
MIYNELNSFSKFSFIKQTYLRNSNYNIVINYEKQKKLYKIKFKNRNTRTSSFSSLANKSRNELEPETWKGCSGSNSKPKQKLTNNILNKTYLNNQPSPRLKRCKLRANNNKSTASTKIGRWSNNVWCNEHDKCS